MFKFWYEFIPKATSVIEMGQGEVYYKKVVIGECKFKNEKIDKNIYDTLIRRGKLITAKYKLTKYIFFSLSGYTDWFETLIDEDVILLTLDSLYE